MPLLVPAVASTDTNPTLATKFADCWTKWPVFRTIVVQTPGTPGQPMGYTVDVELPLLSKFERAPEVLNLAGGVLGAAAATRLGPWAWGLPALLSLAAVAVGVRIPVPLEPQLGR
jgi:hypothetical protein